ncbi:site-2 protease family protein [Veillonella sp. R32]|uniref:site-2 protease family protein n=1 Tax=Veillonella sp. R32 TaxID=2021312 RepID=UPI001389E256|nr:site-2 protease family protein [Veillonella sp. R32]KAF1682069.1 site-2 protease family protein [Veillonella sp. R32]
MSNFSLLNIVAALPAIIIAMAMHEYAHAKVADVLGDDTPRRMGRLTMNPFAHLDFIGMLMLLLLHFGWAKPVVINPANFKNKKRDDMLVSVAGPLANIVVAFVSAFVLFFINNHNIEVSQGLYTVISLMVIINVNFALFNLIPIPPLDGAHIVSNFLSPSWQMKYWQWQRFGFLALILLAYTPFLGMVLIPLQQSILRVFSLVLQFV